MTGPTDTTDLIATTDPGATIDTADTTIPKAKTATTTYTTYTLNSADTDDPAVARGYTGVTIRVESTT